MACSLQLHLVTSQDEDSQLSMKDKQRSLKMNPDDTDSEWTVDKSEGAVVSKEAQITRHVLQ